MTRVLWILAVVTLAVQIVLAVFGGELDRALMAANWSLLLLGMTRSLTLDALLVATAIAGVYAAGKAHRGGWVALFCVALVLGIYGPFAVGLALGVERVFVTFYGLLGLVLEALVPLVALAYALRYRSRRDGSVLARADGV